MYLLFWKATQACLLSCKNIRASRNLVSTSDHGHWTNHIISCLSEYLPSYANNWTFEPILWESHLWCPLFSVPSLNLYPWSSLKCFICTALCSEVGLGAIQVIGRGKTLILVPVWCTHFYKDIHNPIQNAVHRINLPCINTIRDGGSTACFHSLGRGVRSYAQCGCNMLAKFWRLVGCSKRLDW